MGNRMVQSPLLMLHNSSPCLIISALPVLARPYKSFIVYKSIVILKLGMRSTGVYFGHNHTFITKPTNANIMTLWIILCSKIVYCFGS